MLCSLARSVWLAFETESAAAARSRFAVFSSARYFLLSLPRSCRTKSSTIAFHSSNPYVMRLMRGCSWRGSIMLSVRHCFSRSHQRLWPGSSPRERTGTRTIGWLMPRWVIEGMWIVVTSGRSARLWCLVTGMCTIRGDWKPWRRIWCHVRPMMCSGSSGNETIGPAFSNPSFVSAVCRYFLCGYAAGKGNGTVPWSFVET
mmetsp:Transcript_38262/g.67304  ORF Transcript_38262/g.67304 Transcript_38262/m.67304 type:complete len:201 (+) Transcript_38262:69-671(+)